MKHVSTGAGLCALAAAVAGFPIISQLASTERTAQASPAVAAAIAAAAMTQAEPTIVWYGATSMDDNFNLLLRAWSDGRVEGLYYWWNYNGTSCTSPRVRSCGVWTVISDPAAGLAVKADINSDKLVDGEDLAYLLASWGDAPPLSVPPSDCPLNLINP